jgi:hypothetical protein
MPERQSVVKVPSEAVQGKDSFVILRKMTVAQRRTLSAPDLKEEEARPVLIEAIANWNWVWEPTPEQAAAGQGGSPMALPSVDETVFDKLTDQEQAFLWRSFHQISGQAEETLKNSEARSSKPSGRARERHPKST